MSDVTQYKDATNVISEENGASSAVARFPRWSNWIIPNLAILSAALLAGLCPHHTGMGK